MKRIVAAVLLACAAVPAFAEESGAPPGGARRRLTPAEREKAKAEYYRRSGGLCIGMTDGRRYLFVDATADGIDTDYERTFRQMEAGTGIRPLVERRRLDGRTPFDFARELRRSRTDVAALTVFYDGAEGDPVESVFPMERFALVNVTPFGTGDRVMRNHRMNAEMWRAFVFTAGGVSASGFDCVMKNLTDAKDVDKLTAPVACPTFVQGIVNSARRDFGFAQCRRGTYEKACREGWAPAPTNEVQRAIWDKVHEMPSAPIKIKPETKKVSD